MVRRDDRQRARVDAFVRENWPALAAFAWNAFKAQGRGGLLIGWSAVEAWEAGEAVTLAPRYVTYTEVARFGRLIAGYEPERAIVVAVTRGGDGSGPLGIESGAEAAAPTVKIVRAGASFRAWMFEHEPPPPEARASTAN